MAGLRMSKLEDLATVASWIRSEAECRLWCGNRVSYPIDMAGLPESLEYDRSESWVVASDDRIVAFGQLVAKGSRLHLARILAAPAQRGQGFGRLITTHLLETALARKPSAVSLNVFADNVTALTLYQTLGFVPATRPSDERESSSVYMVHSAQPLQR